MIAKLWSGILLCFLLMYVLYDTSQHSPIIFTGRMAFGIIVVYRINKFFVRTENLDRATYVYVRRIASKILVTQKAMSTKGLYGVAQHCTILYRKDEMESCTKLSTIGANISFSNKYINISYYKNK